MLENEFQETKKRMHQTIKKLAKEMAKVRTGQASLAVFEGVTVDYYGTPTPINQVGSIVNPEPNLITIQPWEANLIGEIEKAILAANLGFTPNNDGSIIRIMIPQLTEERRKEYVRQAHKFGENAKTAIRNIRRDTNDTIKNLEKKKQISQDEMRDGLDEVQKITDKHVGEVDKMIKAKEEDILTI